MLESLWIADFITGEVINALAAEGPIYNEDFTRMTVKLREGCHWSDGVPITADDISTRDRSDYEILRDELQCSTEFICRPCIQN